MIIIFIIIICQNHAVICNIICFPRIFFNKRRCGLRLKIHKGTSFYSFWNIKLPFFKERMGTIINSCCRSCVRILSCIRIIWINRLSLIVNYHIRNSKSNICSTIFIILISNRTTFPSNSIIKSFIVYFSWNKIAIS